jgi:tetratricopeptide (TPR) repeat protein
VASSTGSTRAAATLLRVEALVGLGRKEEALALLGPTAGLAPAALAAKRAEVLLTLGRDQDAAAELAKLPSGSEGKDRAAEVYQRSGHHAQAIPLLLELLQADPSSADLRFRLGAAYERTGKVPEAVTVFRELLASAPDYSMALNYLGYMWAEKGENLPEALQLVRRAVELDPDNAAYIDSLGWVYFRMGDFGLAVEQLERAARLLPGDGTVQEHLGDALRAAGKMPEARVAYRRALALGDTDASQVRRKLEEVERDLPRQ